MDAEQVTKDCADGVHGMVPRERMTPSARLLRDTYARVPGVRLFRREFGFFCLERWKEQGMPEGVPSAELFHYDPAGNRGLGGLGWCEAAFLPVFEEKVLDVRGETELVQDHAGRHVLFFRGRRSGFMPEYVTHPVRDAKTWEEDVKWRLDPDAAGRFTNLDEQMSSVVAGADNGLMISQHVIGGYMYLRSLIGPEDLLYSFYDQPDLVHACMRVWLELAEAVTTRHQEYVTLDELFFAEDICYNHGSLISPDMMREFLLPYYQQFIDNVKARQLDPDREELLLNNEKE